MLSIAALVGALFSILMTNAALPPDAQRLLDTFPGRKITLELVVSRALKSADQFKAISAERFRIPAPRFQAESALDWSVYAKAFRNVNRNEPANPFSTNRSETSSYSVGVNKLFSTGTNVNFDLTYGKHLLAFPTGIGFPFSEFNYHQTVASLNLTQSLLRNSFGRASRAALREAEASEKRLIESLIDANETAVLQLIEFYYQAWYAQNRVKLAEDNLRRKKRILEITQIRSRRGTSELPDSLQSKSSHALAITELQAARQQLEEVWRFLVTSLKLPREWLTIDPTEIPMELDEPETSAEKACARFASLKPGETPEPSSAKAYRLQAEAARHGMERTQSATGVDLSLNASIINNGVDTTDASNTYTEAFGFKFPAYTVGVSVVVPLGASGDKAALLSQFSEQERSEALASKAASDAEVEWINACADLKRLGESIKLSQQSFEDQDRRLKLEQDRYQLGRISLVNYMLAGDDAIRAELGYKETLWRRKLVAWRIQRLDGKAKEFLERLGSLEKTP